MKHKIIRLFISSTFNDFKKEREMLNQEIFPQLEEYCAKYGFLFQVVDLRYGVPESAISEHTTMKICLEEVKRCQETNQYFNFLLLMGERYGWVPKPAMIEKEDFEDMVKWLEDFLPKSVEKLKKAYLLDENQIPVSYVLRKEEELVNEIKADKKCERAEAQEIYKSIHREVDYLFFDVFEKISYLGGEHCFDKEKIHSYFISATGQEVLKGIFSVTGEEELKHIVCVFRESGYIKEYLDVDIQKQEELERLKGEIQKHFKERCKKRNFIEYEINGNFSEPEESLKEKLLNSLKQIAKETIDKYQELNIDEQKLHSLFLKEKTEIFLGQENLIKEIYQFATEETEEKIFLLHGARGSGKTALMAKAVETCLKSESHKKINFLYRFIGATGSSSNLRSLIIGIYEQICKQFDLDYVEPANYSVACSRLEWALGNVSKKLVIFIDAIDQVLLQGDNIWQWIPLEIPQNVKFVISIKSDDLIDEKKELVDYKELIKEQKITEIEKRHSREIIRKLLSRDNRTLTAKQLDFVEELFGYAKKPIYLRVLGNLLLDWKSSSGVSAKSLGYSKEEGLDKYSEEDHLAIIVKKFLDKISSKKMYGKALVQYTFAFLSVSHFGLTEKELLALLLSSEKVRDDYKKVFGEYETLEGKNELPFMVWSRLYYSIKNSMKQVGIDGYELINFYHLGMKDIIQDWIKKEENDLFSECRKLLIKYLEEQTFFMDEDRNHPNRRKLTELPYQYMQDKDRNRLINLLSEKEYIWAKIEGGYLRQLMEEIYFALEYKKDNSEQRRQVLEALFEAVLRLQESKGEYGSYFEDIYNLLVFRKNKKIAEEFILQGKELQNILKYLKNKKSIKTMEHAKMVNLESLLKLINNYRRTARIEEAFLLFRESVDLDILDKQEISQSTTSEERKVIEERSRLEYDIAYLYYLVGEKKKAVEHMEKSIENAEKAGNIIGKYISECVLEQIKWYSTMGTAEEKAEDVERLIEKVTEAQKEFSARRTQNESAERWMRSAAGYLSLAHYYKNKRNQKQIKKYTKEFLNTPWSNMIDDDVTKNRQKVFGFLSSTKKEDYKMAYEIMEAYIASKVEEVGWDSEFLRLDYWIILRALYELICVVQKQIQEAKEKDKEFYRKELQGYFQKAEEYYKASKADEKVKMGNMYFSDLIEREMQSIQNLRK